MRILLVHNFYLQPGGEDVVFRAEGELLRAKGHQVSEFTDDNRRIKQSRKPIVALQTIWSWESYSKLRMVIQSDKPDIVHFHNIFPLISASAYHVCQALGVPAIQTLHNYRTVCAAAILYRDGAICEKCVGKKFPWPGIRYRCYHNSVVQTGVVSTSMLVHNLMKTWARKIDAFIALTEFSRSKFLQAGFPREKVFVKPNFVSDVGLPEPRPGSREDFFIYASRWTKEKGIDTLARAWKKSAVPIFIFGDGSFRPFAENSSLRVMNFADRGSVHAYMRRAQALIFPSEWYEGFPVVIVEAFANSLPVIVSNIGSHAEIVRDGYSGLHFRPGDANDLRTRVDWLLNNPDAQEQMSRNARREYEEKYTPERNYQLLMEIYERAAANRRTV